MELPEQKEAQCSRGARDKLAISPRPSSEALNCFSSVTGEHSPSESLTVRKITEERGVG